MGTLVVVDMHCTVQPDTHTRTVDNRLVAAHRVGRTLGLERTLVAGRIVVVWDIAGMHTLAEFGRHIDLGQPEGIPFDY